MDGIELKKWRKESGLSREQVANHLGVSPRTVEAWEQGKAQITDRAESQIKSLMGEMDILAIPLSPELKKKLREIAKSKGVDPAVWAQEILAKILLSALVLFAGAHSMLAHSDWSPGALLATGKAGLSFVASLL